MNISSLGQFKIRNILISPCKFYLDCDAGIAQAHRQFMVSKMCNLSAIVHYLFRFSWMAERTSEKEKEKEREREREREKGRRSVRASILK